MAEGEELRTDNEQPQGVFEHFAVNRNCCCGVDVQFPDCVRYDEARIGFAGMDDSSPPAIRENASLMVSVVFFAEMWRRRVAFEAV
jgi:hypothetical protein